MEPPRYPPMPTGTPFDVTFTDGTTTRILVWERTFPGEPSLYEVHGAPPALSPERAASKWAMHHLDLRSGNGDHTTGIVSIRPPRTPPTPLPPPAPPRIISGGLW